MGALAGKHALVTGGGTGIGAAIAQALAAEGAAVSLAGRRKSSLDEIAKGLPKAVAIVADVTRRADCTAMVRQARAAHGPLDIVIANAGGAESAPAAKITPEHWERMIAVNLTGAFNTVQAALADVARKDANGRIVFTASTAALKGYPYVAAYCAAKHGVVGLMRALALELEPKGVTVNAVCPGYTDTPMLAASISAITGSTGRNAAEVREALARDGNNAGILAPAAVAAKVLWLCGPEAIGVNGQAIEFTGESA